MLIALVLSPIVAFAQKDKKGQPVFREASAREAAPNMAVFVFPQICDLKMISTTRVDYGPYDFALANDLKGGLDKAEIINVQTQALQKACQLSGADLIIEALYTTTVYEKDTKTIWVSLSGYPASYVNFRSLSDKDLEMIKVLYPHGVERVQDQNQGYIVTTAVQGAK